MLRGFCGLWSDWPGWVEVPAKYFASLQAPGAVQVALGCGRRAGEWGDSQVVSRGSSLVFPRGIQVPRYLVLCCVMDFVGLRQETD